MTADRPALAEDLLLLLFDARSGSIRGEGTNLLHALAGAVLTELAIGGHVGIDDRGFWRGTVVVAAGAPPEHALLRPVWDRLTGEGEELTSLVLSLGPALREPVLDGVVERGDLRREPRRILGLIPTSALVDGGTGRREALLAQVRPVLMEDVDGGPRADALAALLSASDQLPALHPEVPWSGAVHDRGKALERGEWGVAAAADAVAASTAALLAATVAAAAAAAAASPR